MSSKFACCKTKDVMYYICITCFGVYHHSCANRLRGIRKLTGNRIVCCSKYEADDNKEADVKLHEEINKLKTEIVDKENFRDFENDVLEIELKFIEEQKINKEQLKVQKEKLCIMHQDLIQTENKNTELLITIEDCQKHLREAEKIINDLRSIESEILTSMSILEQTNDIYAKEIDSLHRRSGTVNGRLLNQDQGDQEYQENLSSYASKDKKVPAKQKKKIVVVGDELSLNVSRLLNIHLNSSEYEAKGIVKCNADFHDISKTVISNWSDCGQNDTIVVIINSSSIPNHKMMRNSLKKVLPCIKSSNLLFLIHLNIRGDEYIKNMFENEIDQFRQVNRNTSIHITFLYKPFSKSIASFITNNYIPKMIESYSTKTVLKTIDTGIIEIDVENKLQDFFRG
nr:unnamed protein product [Callosobruchus analis]